MEQHIRLLDCTLRDGGHLNEGKFGEEVIKNVIERLVEAKIDIIEVGFLWKEFCGGDSARYLTIADVKRVLPESNGNSKFSLMADYIDLNHLEPCDGTVEYIRLSFKRFRLDWGLKTARVLMDKGYKVFINPVNYNVYSDREYIEVLEKVNELHPYGFSMVDTFGVMRISDLSHQYYLIEANLHPDITLGLHLHENLGLAYSLAQHFTQIANPKRKIVIDGSLLGMGRIPGNLCIEQIMDYLNVQYGKNYMTEPVYDAIDDYIAPIKAEIPWGYAIPYALSAKYNLHRTYAEFLMSKRRLKTKDIQRILAQVESSEAETFNEGYIEKLYRGYMNVKYDETTDIQYLKDILKKYTQVLILAPGKTISNMQDVIKSKKDEKTCVISVNFNPEFMTSDLIFLTNPKRYDSIKRRNTGNKLIITSNLLRDIDTQDYIVAYNELIYFNEKFCDDSTLMLLNLLTKLGVKKVMFAGFDGIKNGEMSFYNTGFGQGTSGLPMSVEIKRILHTTFADMNMEFLTESEYI